MCTLDAVAALCAALPDVAEECSKGGHRVWRVGRSSFAWERPLRRADHRALGDAAPTGPVLALHVGDLSNKDALLAEHAGVCFTTPHFDGYPMVLVALDAAAPGLMEELIAGAWLTRASRAAARRYLEG